MSGRSAGPPTRITVVRVGTAWRTASTLSQTPGKTAGVGPEQHAAFRLAQQPRQVLGLEQEIDRVGDARRLRAEQGEKRLRQDGQQHRNGIAFADPELAKEVGRLDDALLELAVADVPRRGIERGRRQVAQGKLVGVLVRDMGEQLEDARLRPVLRQGLPFQRLDVGQGRDCHVIPPIGSCSLRQF